MTEPSRPTPSPAPTTPFSRALRFNAGPDSYVRLIFACGLPRPDPEGLTAEATKFAAGKRRKNSAPFHAMQMPTRSSVSDIELSFIRKPKVLHSVCKNPRVVFKIPRQECYKHRQTQLGSYVVTPCKSFILSNLKRWLHLSQSRSNDLWKSKPRWACKCRS